MTEHKGLQSYRPTAYLDQWVWIRLARAAAGTPEKRDESDLLKALIDAANEGVAFPLSGTHYIETASVKNPRQRQNLAEVMASVSHFRTIRSRRDLLRNQLLVAMHEQFGRPTFRPKNLDPLGVGVHWAFQGIEKVLQLRDEDGNVIDIDQFPPEVWIRATQGFEYDVMSGPRDEEIRVLRKRYGYKPEATVEAGRSRLDWEREFVDLLVDTPPKNPGELRVWIQAREVIHENFELLVGVFREYGLPIRRLTGGFGDDEPERRRQFISGFFDRLPSVQVAVDLKLGVHRNNQRGWMQNDIYDTDAMSIAVPYCTVVVADRAVADALRRVKTGERHGTFITGRLKELADVLPDMVRHARTLPDPSGWDTFAPGVGFRPLTLDQLTEEIRTTAQPGPFERLD